MRETVTEDNGNPMTGETMTGEPMMGKPGDRVLARCDGNSRREKNRRGEIKRDQIRCNREVRVNIGGV